MREQNLGSEMFVALACLACASDLVRSEGESLSCEGCGRSIPLMRTIIDSRDAERDQSAGFSISRDNALAAKLDEAFDLVTTANEVIKLYELLRDRAETGEDVAAIDVRQVIHDNRIAAEPLRGEQLVHGPAILDKLDQYLGDAGQALPSNDMVLEDGAGLGLFVDGFAKRFKRLYVVDLSLCYLLIARKIIEERGLDNVVLICASVEHLPLKEGIFDFVHSNNVVEHVSDQRALFREARRVLKPRGVMFVLSPNRYSLYFEPHFRLPGFGFWPRPISRRIVRKYWNHDIDDVGLLSLNELLGIASEQFGANIRASFIPRRLQTTVTGGRIRDTLVNLLNSRAFGPPSDFVVNRMLLPVMPYHVLVCSKPSAEKRSD